MSTKTTDGFLWERPLSKSVQKVFQRGPRTWQPNWIVSTTFLATKMSTPKLEKLHSDWHWIILSWSSKRKTPTAAVPPSICIGTLCIAIRFALIRFQGTLRCQDSSPNEAPVSRFTDIPATNHVGNVHENNWIFSVRKFLCAKMCKEDFLLPEGPTHVTDSQTGLFPRNFWPPKCQFRSWKTAFRLTLNHIVFKTKNPNSRCSTFNLHRHSMYCNTFCSFALIRFQGPLRCQDSPPNWSPCFTTHRHHGNQSRRECPGKQLMVFCETILCVKVVKKQNFSLPKGPPHLTAKLDGFQEIFGHQNVNSSCEDSGT